MTVRSPGTLVAAATATALLGTLAACSSETGGASGEAGPTNGAEQESGAGSEHEYPEIELPDGVEMAFDWEAPDGVAEAQAVAVAQDFLGAIAMAIAAQDPDHPAYEQYAVDHARQYARAHIEAWVAEGVVMNGVDRYHDLTVDRSGGALTVAFCRDTGGLFAQQPDSGENGAVPFLSDTDLAHHTRLEMTFASIGADETALLAQNVQVEQEAGDCAGDS